MNSLVIVILGPHFLQHQGVELGEEGGRELDQAVVVGVLVRVRVGVRVRVVFV